MSKKASLTDNRGHTGIEEGELNSGKQLSNPFSTGGGGVFFESHVQAAYVVLMLTVSVK